MSSIDEMIEERTECIREMMETLVDCLKEYIGNDISKADTDEVGTVVDVIKDLAEAEAYIVKSEYHKQIMNAMADNPEVTEAMMRSGISRI